LPLLPPRDAENSVTTVLLSRGLGLVAVMLDVCLGCFGAVVGGVVEMSLCAMGVMGRCFVAAGLMVAGRFAMMLRRVLVMVGCQVMMLGCCFGHGESSCHCGLPYWRCEANGPVLQLCDSGITRM
jgi:hypothetical protein